ncbi:MAG: hypothetical protein WCS70_09675 [Verrucomicrobiota bacterium]
MIITRLALLVFFGLLSVAAADETNPVDITALVKDRRLWPKEVALFEKVSFPITIGGQASGSAEIPAGTLVRVIDILTNGVRVAFGESATVLPMTATDLRERATAMRDAKAKLRAVPAQQQDQPAQRVEQIEPPKMSTGRKAWGKLGLPCVIVVTKSTVNSYTGAVIDEKSRNQIKQVTVVFRRYANGEADEARFYVREIDRDDYTLAAMPYGDKKELLDVLRSLGKKRLAQSMNPATKEETVFSSGDVELRLAYTATDKRILPLLMLGTATFILQSNTDVSDLINEVDNL